MTVADKEAEYIRNMLWYIKLWPQHLSSISLNWDSETTMSRAYSNIYNGKSWHISIQHGYVRELFTNEVILTVYVKSLNNLMDPLTKRLFRDMVRKTTNEIWLKPIIKDTDNENLTLD